VRAGRCPAPPPPPAGSRSRGGSEGPRHGWGHRCPPAQLRHGTSRAPAEGRESSGRRLGARCPRGAGTRRGPAAVAAGMAPGDAGKAGAWEWVPADHGAAPALISIRDFKGYGVKPGKEISPRKHLPTAGHQPQTPPRQERPSLPAPPPVGRFPGASPPEAPAPFAHTTTLGVVNATGRVQFSGFVSLDESCFG